jgi:sulfite exporter TauE/SafE
VTLWDSSSHNRAHGKVLLGMNLFVSMLGIGIITSFHCVAMCGGLVLACAVKGAQEGPWWRRLTPHLVYQATKIASYAAVALVLGGVVALLGRAVDITGFRNWLMIVAGFYMVLLGLSMTGRFTVLRYLSPRPPKFLVTALSGMRRRANVDADTGHHSLAAPLALGALTGLMPCAPLIAAQAAAISSGSPLSAAFAMIGFGLGTAPLMLAFGFFSTLLSRAFQRKLQIVSALAVILFGLVILNRGLMLVGSPVTFDTMRTAIVSSPSAGTSGGFETGADGVVEVPITIRDTEYIPREVVVPADSPVRLVVDRQEDFACSDQLSIPAAGNLLVDLKPNGVTRIDVPPMRAGTYTLTCGMGMMSGSIVAVASAGGSTPTGRGLNVLTLVLLLLIVAALAVHVWRSVARCRAEDAKRGLSSGGALRHLTTTEIVVAIALFGAAVLLALALGGYFH